MSTANIFIRKSAMICSVNSSLPIYFSLFLCTPPSGKRHSPPPDRKLASWKLAKEGKRLYRLHTPWEESGRTITAFKAHYVLFAIRVRNKELRTFTEANRRDLNLCFDDDLLHERSRLVCAFGTPISPASRLSPKKHTREDNNKIMGGVCGREHALSAFTNRVRMLWLPFGFGQLLYFFRLLQQQLWAHPKKTTTGCFVKISLSPTTVYLRRTGVSCGHLR